MSAGLSNVTVGTLRSIGADLFDHLVNGLDASAVSDALGEWMTTDVSGRLPGQIALAFPHTIDAGLLDTYGWPTFWHTHGDGTFIAPSLDLNASLHPVGTSPDWLLIDCAVQVGRQGRIGFARKVLDADGHLVATGASQLCCGPAPRS